MTPPIRRKSLTERRREDLQRIDQMSVKVTRVSGRVLLIGSGEATVDIPFPVYFVERPIFGFGGEMDDNFRVEALSFPTISAIVVDWVRVKAIENVTPGYYESATVAAVTTGQSDQQIWLHYSFEAQAIRNPITTATTLEDTL